jgi:hypothetical protein
MDLALGLSDRQPGRFATTEAPPIALAPDAPAGTYHVTLGLYSRTTGRRLPVASGAAMPQLDGADAELLTTIEHR